MSNLSSKMQDALCTLSTGGGYAARKLYSDSDETVIEVKRPVIINGIVPIATRSDLIDRIIHIDLPKLSDNYQSIRELDEAFKNDVPAIFGELLDITVKTLNALPSIKLSKPPRMADFAVLGEAVHIAMEINEPFIDVYNKNRGDSLRRSIESSPAAIAIQDLIRRDGSFYGTFKELKSELDSHLQRSSEGWPRSPKGLSEVLRRMGPALKETNILVEFLGHRNDGSYVSIKRVFESKDNDHNHHSVTESEFKNLFGDEVTEVTVANKVGQPKVLDYATAKDPG